MSSTVFVLGIDFVTTQSEGEHALLNVSRPLRTVDTDNYKRRTFGESGTINPKYDKPLKINRPYAEMLERTGALVGRQSYDVELGLGDDPLAGAVVTKLIPVDGELKKHFDACLKGESQHG